MNKEYFIVENESRVGPLSFEQLKERGLNASTLVWTAGMADWARADSCPDLRALFIATAEESDFGAYVEPEQTAPEARQQNANSSDPGPQQYQYGQSQNPCGNQYQNYSQAQQNQQYGQQNHTYGQQSPYGQFSNFDGGQFGEPNVQVNTNWQTLAIIATVCGFLFSCIGGIIGIFGILQANKAGKATMMGNSIMAKNHWSSCKTLTIIAFIFAGLGLVANIWSFSLVF